MSTGSFPGVKCGRGVLLTTHPFLVPRSWKSRAIPLPTLWAKPGLLRDHINFTITNGCLGQKVCDKSCDLSTPQYHSIPLKSNTRTSLTTRQKQFPVTTANWFGCLHMLMSCCMTKIAYVNVLLYDKDK